MDQELKQRLIGAAVITALAAIFVPMLFDDPVDETGKSINELKIPELPEKTQDVEIMPLPEKVEDVAIGKASETPAETTPAPGEGEDLGEVDVEAPRPRIRLSDREVAVSTKHPPDAEPEEGAVHADADAPVAEAENDTPDVKPTKSPAHPAQTLPAVTAAAKVLKPANPTEPAAKEAGTRWYLNAGSFGKKANALSLLDSLKQQGFAASIKEVAGEKGTVYKVRIGPMLDKAKAQAVKNKLTQINVNSFVAPDE